MLADVSIATGWMTIALMLTGRFVFQVSTGVHKCAVTASCLADNAALHHFVGFRPKPQSPGWGSIGVNDFALSPQVSCVLQYLGWGVAATATPVVMLLAGGTFFGTSVLSRVGTSAAAGLAAAGATAGAVTQVTR